MWGAVVRKSLTLTLAGRNITPYRVAQVRLSHVAPVGQLLYTRRRTPGPEFQFVRMSNFSNSYLDDYDEIREKRFEDMVKQLKDFVDREGHAKVPGKYGENPTLGRWVGYCRAQYRLRLENKCFRMTDERIKKLEEVGMVWSVREEFWDEAYKELADFYKAHGHTLVPKMYNRRLYKWVDRQRQNYKLNMTQERKELLNRLNFQIDLLEAMWAERYRELCEYRKNHGDCMVPVKYESNVELGTWVDVQRQQYRKYCKGVDSSMTAERIQQLNEIEFCWNAQDAKWNKKLDELREYVETNGYGQAPRGRTELKSWLRRQLAQFKKIQDGEKAPLTEERIEKLRKLGFLIGGKRKKN